MVESIKKEESTAENVDDLLSQIFPKQEEQTIDGTNLNVGKLRVGKPISRTENEV